MPRYWTLALFLGIAVTGWGREWNWSAIPAMTKLDSTAALPATPETLTVELGRNERESIQLLLGNSGTAPLEFSLHLKAPVDMCGNTVTVTPFLVGYVDAYNLWAPHNLLGNLPDPLLPLPEKFTVAPGRQQSILLQVGAKATAPTGVYQGMVEVTSAGTDKVSIPFEVEVLDYTLPVEQNFTVAIPIWGNHLETMYPGKAAAARSGLLDLMLAYRIAPIAVEDDEIQRMIDGGQRAFCLLALPKDSVAADRIDELAAKRETWRKNGWLDVTSPYVLLGDEPPPEYWDIIRQQGLLVHEKFPEIARVNTINYEADRSKVPIDPNIAPELNYYYQTMKALEGSVDYFMPANAPSYPIDGFEQLRRQMGQKAWWYYIAGGFYIPSPGMAMRIYGWMHWKYQVPAMLHWGMTYWDGEGPVPTNTTGVDGKKWPDVPWDTKSSRCGDGYLIYPARDDAGYWPSLRLENLRDAAEDYELLRLLDRTAKELETRFPGQYPEELQEAHAILAVDPGLVKSTSRVSQDPAVLLHERRRAAKCLARCNAILHPPRRDGTTGKQVRNSPMKYRWIALAGLATMTVTAQSPWLANPADSMRKVLREEPAADLFGSLSGKPWEESAVWEPVEIARAKCLRLELARNETESIQLVIHASDQPVRDVKLTLSPLVNATGDVFPADRIDIEAVGYIDMVSLWQKDLALGAWPDPLLPLGEAPKEISPGANQAYWLRFRTAMDTPPGVYHGQLTVTAADGGTRIFPVEVKVWNFTLPTEQHFTASIPIWGGAPALMHENFAKPELRRKLLEMMAAYRISPFPLDADEIKFMGERGQRWFCMQCFPKDRPVNDADREQAVRLAKMWREVAGPGWVPYVLLGDEPKTEQWPFIVGQGKMIREVFPEAVRCNTLCMYGKIPGKAEVFFPGDYENRYLAYYDESFRNLKDGVDLFIPAAGRGTTVADSVALAERYGLKLWWYYVADWVYIPSPGAQARMMPWIHWRYNIPGFLHWGMNYWDGEEDPTRPNTAGIDGKKWPDIPWNSGGSRSGDGYLVYPARDGAGYWPSARLENLRDGIEDYEYFHLLQSLVAEADAAGRPVPPEARELLQIRPELVTSPYEYTTDPAALRSTRRRLGDAIERMTATP